MLLLDWLYTGLASWSQKLLFSTNGIAVKGGDKPLPYITISP